MWFQCQSLCFVSLRADNTELQQDVLAFINTVLIMDHPRLCKPLRNNILSIKVCIHRKKGVARKPTNLSAPPPPPPKSW